MKSQSNNLPIHPFLFAIYPILLLLTVNIDEANIYHVIAPAIAITCIVASIFLLINIKIKDSQASALIVSLTVCLFFSYGPCSIYLNNLISNQQTIDIIIIVLTIFAFFIGYWSIRESKLNLGIISDLCNVFSASLVALSLFSIVRYYSALPETPDEQNKTNYFRKIVFEDSTQLDKSLQNPLVGNQNNQAPHIFYFVFDRYTNDQVLLDVYNLDNSKFSSYLRSAGFKVVDRASSNYPKTILSLASTLNLSYLDQQTDSGWTKLSSIYPLSHVLNDNRVIQFLKRQGYQVWHFGSWWEPTQNNKNANRNINYSILSEFSMALYESTLLSALSRDLLWSHEQWTRVTKQFQILHESLKQNSPTFVFAHFTIPHPPAVFTKDGDFKGPLKRRNYSDEENYLEQLQYVNQELYQFVELALKTKPQPIIIIQSDEGPLPKRFREEKEDLKWEQATVSEIQQKLGIINAYFFPDIEENQIPDKIVPVNTFRVLFNLYFGTELTLLEERYYTLSSQTEASKLIDVSEKLRPLN